MAISTVRPNDTPLGASNFTIFGGAASINDALSDNNVSTYIKKGVTGNGAVMVGFGTTTIASNVRVKQVRVRAQVQCPTTSSRLRITPVVRVSGVNYFGSAQIYSGSFALAEYAAGYFTTAPDGQAWDQDRIDSLRAQIQDNASGSDLSSIYELFFDIETTTQPTLTVSAPTGTVTATDQPDVTWAYSDTDGSAQDYYEVRVFSSTQYSASDFDAAASTATWESGAVASDDNTVTILEHLSDATTYRAYVRAAKIVSNVPFYSEFAYSQFTVNTSPPSAPTLTATFSAVNNRVDVTVTAPSIAGSFDSQVLQVQRSDDGGTTWADVVGGSDLVPDGSLIGTLDDYAAPRGATARYRARSIATLGDNLVASAWSSTATVSVTNDQTWWLKSVLDPSLNKGSLRVAHGFETKVEEQIGVFRPLGRRTAVTVSAGLQGEDGSYEIKAIGATEFDNVWALVTHEGVLLVQSPLGDQKYIRITARSYSTQGKLANAQHAIKVEYVEVSV